MSTQEAPPIDRAPEIGRTQAGKSVLPKYDKPKIMLLDMPDACEKVLRDAGYNITVGTFGVPYPVPRSDSPSLVAFENCKLPNSEEQEIIVANTACPDATGRKPSRVPGDGVSEIWQIAESGEIDPRPFAMVNVRKAFDRVLEHGGIAIVLLSCRYSVKYVKGYQREFGTFRSEEEFTLASWSLLSDLREMGCSACKGNELEFLPEGQDFGKLLKRGAAKASYSCAVHPSYDQENHWIPLARNKYGDCVAGMLIKSDPQTCLVVLPQMPELHTILPDLIGRWCSQWRPKLFPFHEANDWLHAKRYELPAISRLWAEIARVEQQAESQVTHLEAEIEKLRQENEDWYTLLNGTGSDLVGAVIHSLQRLGFNSVIDVDEEAKTAGDDRSLREDIQIRDESPILIVDVKGITGVPEDSEATQAEKHALMRAKEFQGNVKPLTIVNHQRNLPPHERQQEPYRKAIVDNANQTGLGLMTTWDLFRLLRDKEALGWSREVVCPIFYRTGRIYPIPEHYVEIGAVVHCWSHALGIVPNQAVALNDTLAVATRDLFEEIPVKSLQVDGEVVAEALANSNCGIACDGASDRFKEGMRVFLVKDGMPILANSG